MDALYNALYPFFSMIKIFLEFIPYDVWILISILAIFTVFAQLRNKFGGEGE